MIDTDPLPSSKDWTIKLTIYFQIQPIIHRPPGEGLLWSCLPQFRLLLDLQAWWWDYLASSLSSRIKYNSTFQCHSMSSGLKTHSITPAEIRTLPIILPTKMVLRRTPLVGVLSRCRIWPVQPTLSSIRSWVGVRVVTGIFSRNWATTPAISQVINHQYTEPVHSSMAPESKVLIS